MAEIPAIGALNAALDFDTIAAEYAIRTLRAQLEAAEQIGAEAVQLIEAAAVDPEIAQTINILV